MTTETCEREPALLAALRRGRLADDDAAHLAACARCALAVDAERWMAGAVAAFAAPAVPSAGSLLLRAQLRARRDAAERSLRPLRAWRRIVAVGGGAFALFALTRSGGFFAGLWSAAPSSAEAILAAGTLALASLPVWLRLRRDGA